MIKKKKRKWKNERRQGGSKRDGKGGGKYLNQEWAYRERCQLDRGGLHRISKSGYCHPYLPDWSEFEFHQIRLPTKRNKINNKEIKINFEGCGGKKYTEKGK